MPRRGNKRRRIIIVVGKDSCSFVSDSDYVQSSYASHTHIRGTESASGEPP